MCMHWPACTCAQQLQGFDAVLLLVQVRVVHGLVKATPSNKDAIAASINNIRAGSMTNLSGGLFQGIAQQQDGQRPGQQAPAAAAADNMDVDSTVAPTGATGSADASATISSVFCFTDGMANGGITDQNSLLAALNNLLRTSSRSTSELKIHTFGFGADHSPTMLQGISDAGNGTYYYIEGEENIAAAFADALGGLLSVFAQNVELRIKPRTGDGAAITKVHTGLQQRTDGSDQIVSMPDLFAEEGKDLIIDFAVPVATGDNVESNTTLAEVEVRYIDATRGTRKMQTLPITLRRMAELPAAMQPHADIAVHRARIDAAERMREAVRLADQGNTDSARAVLRAHANVINDLLVREESVAGSESDWTEVSVAGAAAAPMAAPSAAPRARSHRHATLTALRQDLHHCEGQLQDAQQWHSHGRMYAMSNARSHAAQRSTGLGYGGSGPRRAPGTQTAPALPVAGGYSATAGMAPMRMQLAQAPMAPGAPPRDRRTRSGRFALGGLFGSRSNNNDNGNVAAANGSLPQGVSFPMAPAAAGNAALFGAAPAAPPSMVFGSAMTPPAEGADGVLFGQAPGAPAPAAPAQANVYSTRAQRSMVQRAHGMATAPPG